MINEKKWLLPWIIAIAMFIETLDSTIVGVAIPAIAASFHINPVDMKLALTGYLLSLSIFIPISGWLADQFGEKRIFIGAMVIFVFSSLLCALATNLVSLILARILQGLGGALMMPVGRLIILRKYSKKDFVNVMSMVVIPGLLGPALGPTIGGIIIKFTSWHWIFLVNIPLGIIGIIASYYCIPASTPLINRPFNWQGFLLFSTGLAAVTCSMALLGDNFDLLVQSAMLALLATILLASYCYLSKRQKHPLFNINLFKKQTFYIAIIVSLIGRQSIGAIPFLLPLLLQMIWHKTPLYSGMVFMFFALGMINARLLLKKRVLVYLGYKRTLQSLIIGLTAISMLLSLFTHPMPFYYLAILLFVMGILTSQFYITINSLSLTEIDSNHFSQTTSISSTIQQFSAGLGIALAAILLHLFSYLLHKPLFSGIVFFWTFILLNSVSLLSLLFIHPLDSSLNENKPSDFTQTSTQLK